MPYEYRSMTPEERREVLRFRRDQHYPLHAPPHPYRDGGWYFLTAANFLHVSVMSSVQRRSEFETRLLRVLHEAGAEVHGWVVLPNHYHVLVGVHSLDQVSPEFQRLHGATSREWNMEDGLTGKRRVWYKFTDRALRDELHFYRALNYLHVNPVKHRYVSDPYEWPWSSVHSYEEMFGREWLREKWKDYTPTYSGRGWDD